MLSVMRLICGRCVMSWREFREFDKKGLLFDKTEGWRSINLEGYVVDRRYFIGWFLLTALLLVVLGVVSGASWEMGYLVCPSSATAPCENPVYGCDAGWCASIGHLRTVPPGFEFGESMPVEFYNWLIYVVFVSAVLFWCFVLMNHLQNNKGKKLAVLFAKLRRD